MTLITYLIFFACGFYRRCEMVNLIVRTLSIKTIFKLYAIITYVIVRFFVKLISLFVKIGLFILTHFKFRKNIIYVEWW